MEINIFPKYYIIPETNSKSKHIMSIQDDLTKFIKVYTY